MTKKVRRLYDQFQPEHYELVLIPDRDRMTFTGTVTITGRKVGRPSQRLTFHQNALKVASATATYHSKKGDQPVTIDRLNHHKSLQEVRLHASHMLYPGEYTITLEFSGHITRPMEGIYPCFFTDRGEAKQLIATQFESHDARAAFPCIDEPEAKATFQLTLSTPKGETVLSNTPIKQQKTIAQQVVTTFETTPKMSTYLLAFVFGDMGHLEATTKHGTLIRTFATPDNVTHTKYALDIAVKCLDFYEDYFGIPFPLPKCDLVALPDFASGAMENWGLITFREHTILMDPKHTSLGTKQYVAMVVAHELAHQWFGNLVTMRWWTDLWLNEGFASWIEYMAVDHLFPEWQMWTQFIVDEQQAALKLDALEHTHPVEVPVNHPDEIRTIFDAISYNKGASVIHMLHDYLGDEAFRQGLHAYLTQHQYSNTDTIDLWSALAKSAHKPVKKFMHSWTSLSGHPLLEAELVGKKLTLQQKRFLVNPKGRSHHKQSELWPIPLLANDPRLPTTLSRSRTTIEDPLPTLKLNYGQGGFYRVAYNHAHWVKLTQLVSEGVFEPLDRLGLLADAFEAAKAGFMPTTDALQLLTAYNNENNAAVWEVIAGAVGALRTGMDNEPLRELLKPFVRRLTAQQLKRLGWEERPKESHFDRLLRPTILGLAAVADDEVTVKECQQRFAKQATEPIHPDVRGVVYSTVARLGAETEFNNLLKMHHDSTNSDERLTLSAALTNFQQPALVKRALELITTEEVRLQDVSYWVAYSFMNRHAKHATWQWLQNHWQWLEDNIGSDLSFYRMPIYVARVFGSNTFLDEYKQFFEAHMTPALKRSYQQGIEMIEWQAAWKDRDLAAIKTYFSATV